MYNYKNKLQTAFLNLLKPIRYLIGSPRAHKARIKQLVDADDYPARMRQFMDYAHDDESHSQEEPVFIFSAGWRSGSTLLQRLLSSSESLLLWGEPHDRCNIIQSLAATIKPFNDNWPPRKYITDNDNFEQKANKWIANFYPNEARMLAAHREFLRTMFAPNLSEGAKRWGIKEVRFGLVEAVYLKALFPKAKFLYLKRELDDAYSSYKNFSPHMNWYAKWPSATVFTPYSFAKHRARLVKEFTIAHKLTGGLLLNYSDIVTRSETITDLELYCHLGIDRNILQNKVGSSDELKNKTQLRSRVSWLESCLLRLGNISGSKPAIRFGLFKRLLNIAEQRSFSPSTAQKLVAEFKNKDIDINVLATAHLRSSYASMSPTNDRPDFKKVTAKLTLCEEITEPADDKCLGVILETRCHPLLEQVVLDFVSRTGCRVQLFHGLLNLDFILSSKIQTLVQQNKVILSPLNTEILDGKTYNTIMLTETFWNALDSRQKIFVFQTDSLLCSASKKQLSDFLHYDYIGSWWKRLRPIGIKVDGGNGGLSIRDWHMSMDCIKRFDPTYWPGGEDGYFAFHIDLIGGNIARGHHCAEFSTQYRFLYNSYGCHKISCLNSAEKSKFLRYFPGAAVLLSE